MSLRTALAARLTPILLRLALAAVFLWAGYSKVFVHREYSPAELATLANMGVSRAKAAATGAGASITPRDEPPPPTTPDGPGAPLPDPTRKGRTRGSGSAVALVDSEPAVASLAALATAEDSPGAAALPASDLYDASRFEKGAPLANAYMIALMLHGAAADPPDPSHRRLWPAAWARGSWPVRFAWAAALTELVGGALCLLGFFARFAGLSLAGVMLVAMWLATIGPNLGAPNAFLGFLPQFVGSKTPPDAAMPLFAAWSSFFLQLTCLVCALGVLLSGAGSLSLDAFVFSSKPRPPKTPKAEG